MRKSWGSLVFGVGFGTVAVVAVVVGCGATGSKPEIGAESQTDGSITPSGNNKTDGGGDGGTEGGATGTIPTTCSNTIKDNKETDVDCGGGACLPCIDGQACSGATDCLGGNCVSGTCATPQCTNAAIDTGETDVDCGGSTCRRCTIGKRCSAGTDCVSGSCNNKQCSCPAGMAVAARKNGNSYCVDEIEVSKYQYNQFLKAGVIFDNQVEACRPPTNTSFVPRGAWPPGAAPPGGVAGEGPGTPFSPRVGQAFNYAIPVHYVDWCDAAAYCTWAKKQLCGSTTGGSVDFSKGASAADDAWYNACSSSGDLVYPYSVATFSSSRCNAGQAIGAASGPNLAGPAVITGRSGFGDARNQDEGILANTNGDGTGTYSLIYGASCQGGYTGIYQMTGNVAEWEDSCDGTGANAKCRVRGGSFLSGVNNSTGLRCDDLSRSEARVPALPSGNDEDPLRDIGIRCCLF